MPQISLAVSHELLPIPAHGQKGSAIEEISAASAGPRFIEKREAEHQGAEGLDTSTTKQKED